MGVVHSCEIVTKNERRKRDWQRFLILLRGSSIAQLTWERVPRDDMSVSDSCERCCGLCSVWGGRVRLGGGPQDFQCFNRIGNKSQVNFWMKVEKSQGDSNFSSGLNADLPWVWGSSWLPERRKRNPVGFECLHFYSCGVGFFFCLIICLFVFNCKRGNTGLGNA